MYVYLSKSQDELQNLREKYKAEMIQKKTLNTEEVIHTIWYSALVLGIVLTGSALLRILL